MSNLHDRTVPPDDARAADTRSEAIPVVEETLDIDKEEHVEGRVRVSTRTESVDRLVEETLSSTTASVTRVPLDRELAPGEPVPEARVEGGVTVVPVLEERLVVEKRLVLVEELHIERHVETESVSIPVSLRRQRVDVERLPGDEPDPPIAD